MPEEEKVEVDEKVEAPSEVSSEEQDAVEMYTGGGKGEVKPNPSFDEEIVPEEESEQDVEIEEEPEVEEEIEEEVAAEESVQFETEEDKTGVYEPITANNPGDFQPGDYSFVVQTADGRSRRINSLEDAESLAKELDNNPELITASQFLSLGRKTALMEQGIANDRRVYEQQKEEYDFQASQAATREQYLTQWQGEINYLRQKGELPSIAPELNNADWTNPSVASQSGVKEAIELLKWMETENSKRIAAGLPPDLSIVSAHNSRQLENIRNADKEETTKQKDISRARGAMVGKRAPYSPGNESKKNAIIGTARGLEDLVTESYYA